MHELVFAPRGAFSLAATTERFARLSDSVSVVEDGVFVRLVHAGAGTALLRVTQAGPPSRASLRVSIEGAPDERSGRAAAQRLLERVLGAGADLRAFQRAHARDPLLAAPLRAHRGLRVAGSYDLFEALVNAVLTQQVNLRFAYSIRAELVRAFGASRALGGRDWLAFPTAERIARESETTLRGFRLSAAKAAALARLARACAEGELDEAKLALLSDEEAIAELVRWKGVGRWTAEVVLIRGLGRLDVFPAGDLAVLKRLAPDWLASKKKPSEADVRAFADRWKPYRSLALVYGLEALAAKPYAAGPASGAQRAERAARRSQA